MMWFDEAACLGKPTSWFFPSGRPDWTAAREVCASCPVSDECLADAFRYESPHVHLVFGMRGGLTPEERIALRRGNRMVLRRCASCHQDFRVVARSGRQAYCSDECQRHARRQSQYRSRLRTKAS